jgi:hypothetical protein
MEESYSISSGKFKFIGASFILSLSPQVALFTSAKRVTPEELPYIPPIPPPETALPA